LLFLSPGSSFADEHGTDDGLHWVMERDQLWSVDSSDAGGAPNFFSFVRIITVSGGEGPILQLSCQATSRGDQMLQAGIKLDPENTYEQAPKEHLRLLEMSGKLTVGSDRKSERFQYHPDSSKITPRNRTVPKRLFNAVVRGDPVQLKVRNKTYDLAVPGVDPVFTMFAKTCPVTNGGTFDESIFENAKGMRTEATATD
jgi:hypothetical protein